MAKWRKASHLFWWVWTCALADGAVDDFNSVVKQAQELVRRERTASTLQALEDLLYRAGRYDEAVDALQKSATQQEAAPRSSNAYTHFFLAMAHHRLGHEKKARQYLNHGVEEAKAELSAEKPPWRNRRLTLELLRNEAGNLILAPPQQLAAPKPGNPSYGSSPR